MEGSIKKIEAEAKPRYYVVRMDGQGKAPTRYHHQRNHAYKAAESLARKNPGVEFIVVKQKTSLVFSENIIPLVSD